MSDEHQPDNAPAEDAPRVEGAEAEAQQPETQEDPEAKVRQNIAKTMGWKAKEEWKGDDSKWVDADAFLGKTGDTIKSLKDQFQRVVRTAEHMVAKNRAQAIRDAEAMVRQAAEVGDLDGVDAAARNLSRVTAENADTGGVADRDAFLRRNPWYESNPEAQGLAFGAAQRVANAGGTPQEQFEAAEQAVRKRMPELFDAPAATTPAPRAPKAPPTVQAGNRTPGGSREPGVADLPPEARKAGEKFVRSGMVENLAEYAKAYWAENPKERA